MSDKSSIEWLNGGATWNPIRARNLKTGKVGWFCEHASAGCLHCYAETMNQRVRTEPDGSMVGIGNGLAYKPVHLKDVEIFLDEKILTAPLRWRAPRLVFPCSMTDLFGRWVTDEMLDRIFAVMALAPRHQFLCLTKRADRMRDYFAGVGAGVDGPARRIAEAAEVVSEMVRPFALPSEAIFDGRRVGLGQPWQFVKWPLPNVWLGVSVEDQQRADERIPLLLQTPAAVRWVSYEPALGAVDFTGWLWGRAEPCSGCPRDADCDCGGRPRRENDGEASLSWIVVGGESGPWARPFDLAWARSTVRQCRGAGVPVFVKQLGAKPYVACCRACRRWARCACVSRILEQVPLRLKSRKGGKPEEWDEDLRVRQMPEVRS